MRWFIDRQKWFVADADENLSSLLRSDRFSCDEGINSEELILSGSSLINIGVALAWVYCNTRLSSLCQGMSYIDIFICVWEQ